MVDLARTLSQRSGITRGELVTRRIVDAAVGPDYAEPIEDLTAKVRMATLFPLRRYATPGRQCALIASGDYRSSLCSPWPVAIVENSMYDYYWACGRDGRERNTYGKVLMAVRDKLKS